MKKNPLEMIQHIGQILYSKKATNIIAIDVRGISSITDYVIIANGNVDRHVIALAKLVEEELKTFGEKTFHIEGMQNGDWIVLDYFNILIHLFVPEMRLKYQLERLWSEGKIIDLELDESKNEKMNL